MTVVVVGVGAVAFIEITIRAVSSVSYITGAKVIFIGVGTSGIFVTVVVDGVIAFI